MRHRCEQALLAWATRSAPRAALVITGCLISAWTVTYLSGGTHTAMLHVFYLPVVGAANRFRHAGALVVALCAGLLAGPLMPLDVAAGIAQEPMSWLFRLTFFVLIGQVVALLRHRSLEGLSTAVSDRRMKAELETALDRGDFRVVYQPLFDLTNRAIVGAEALLRWEHPVRGLMTPEIFIDAAERTGCIVPIGTWVLKEAALQAVQWRADSPADLKVAVNLSARQLDDDELLDTVASILHETGLPPAALQLEITETALIIDIAGVTRRLEQLRYMGVGIAIDDFGTGQSSLAYVHRLPADVIKIDRSFVQALDHDTNARMVVEGIVRLSAKLGLATVAEGIETDRQADILSSFGCDIGQGYLFARPSNPDQIERFLSPAISEAASVKVV